MHHMVNCLFVRQVRDCEFPWLEGAMFSPNDRGGWRIRLRVVKQADWKQKIAEAERQSEQAGTPQSQQDAARRAANLTIASANDYTSLARLLCWYGNGAPRVDKPLACHYYCDNPICLNPKHLSWGSADDNVGHREWHREKAKGMHPEEACPPKYFD